MEKARIEHVRVKIARMIWVTFLCAGIPLARAHQGHHHALEPTQNASLIEHGSSEEAQGGTAHLKQIGAIYLAKVRPIFEKKCMDCHSSKTHYPFYYMTPGVKSLIDGDIAVARGHLDMTQNFPFKSHASVLEDLEAIEESVQTGSMPPFRYRLLHPSATLSISEKAVIRSWTQEAKQILKKQSP